MTVGKPIYPLTGSVGHVIDLGLAAFGGRITYDTLPNLPVTNAGTGHDQYSDPLDRPASSLGQLWFGFLGESLSIVNGSIYLLATKERVYKTLGVVVVRDDGKLLTFSQDDSGALTPQSDTMVTLNKTDAGYTLSDPENGVQEIYDANGLLLKKGWLDGTSWTYIYSDPFTPPEVTSQWGTLIRVDNAAGRSLSLSYTGSQLTQIVDPSGGSTGFHYDAKGNLDRVVWPDTNYIQLVYDNGQIPWALTHVVDENGATTLSYEYDAKGRASATELGGHVQRYEVDYGIVGTPLALTDLPRSDGAVIRSANFEMGVPPVVHQPNAGGPNARDISATATVIFGLPRVASRSQPAGAGCAAASMSMDYGANGTNVTVTSKVDVNGNRSCFAYESARNLRTIALEGLQSSGTCPADLSGYQPPQPVKSNPLYDPQHPQRKTTTSWHPKWALKTKEAQPQKLTTWVYNGAGASCAPAGALLPDGTALPLLCSRTEQATSDLTGGSGLGAAVVGSARTWSYTYDVLGHMLTETAPALNAGDAPARTTTTYTYYTDRIFDANGHGHAVGDLQQELNSLGQATVYTSYDLSGRLLASMDANGVTTALSYWPRGWVHTQTQTSATGRSLTTTYDYWPTGLLHVATLPNGVVLTYLYDDAHRLTDVTDSAGNTVHYTLDDDGNRTGEDVKDASGHLASTVARVFDSLTRLQSVTGAFH